MVGSAHWANLTFHQPSLDHSLSSLSGMSPPPTGLWVGAGWGSPQETQNPFHRPCSYSRLYFPTLRNCMILVKNDIPQLQPHPDPWLPVRILWNILCR